MPLTFSTRLAYHTAAPTSGMFLYLMPCKLSMTSLASTHTGVRFGIARTISKVCTRDAYQFTFTCHIVFPNVRFEFSVRFHVMTHFAFSGQFLAIVAYLRSLDEITRPAFFLTLQSNETIVATERLSPSIFDLRVGKAGF